MPWKDKTVKSLRKEFVTAAAITKNFSSLCREFGITRKTGYKWLQRHQNEEDLDDKSRAPHTVAKKTSPETEAQVLKVRDENPEWGGKTILKFLENQGHRDLPCVKTANNILKRNGRIDESESLKRMAYKRFERERCNELWQVDFKGDFLLKDKTRCFPLDILDDCSRYSIAIFTKSNTVGVKDCFEQVFREYGLPDAILSDNGVQFSGFRGGYTQFERWLMDLDIRPIHGRIMHPQTQGKIERFHRTMKNECLKHHDFSDLADADYHLQKWRKKYNEIRPHEALGMKCPAEVYHPSEKAYPDKIKPYEYSGKTIKINNWGYLRFNNTNIYLSETMGNTYVEVRLQEEDTFMVCYRNYKIAEVDAVTLKLRNRRIARL